MASRGRLAACMSVSRFPERRTAPRVEPPDAGTSAQQPATEQLQRILRSETFHKSDRLKRFLMFIVREAAAGRGAQLKEYVIGVQVFRKEDSFDPRTDPIVRVQARRLRAKLVRYYREEGRADPTLIELPKGGYAPLIKQRDDTATPRRSVSAALVNRNTITVLPFDDHSVDGSLSAISEGLRDEVVHQLARLPGLRILAGVTADRGEHSASTTGGDAALRIAGSVRQSGDRLRITVHL